MRPSRLLGALLVSWALAAVLAPAAVAPAAVAQSLLLDPVGAFDQPVFVTAPPGDSHRLFVVERAGRIRIVKNGGTLSEPFLDITGRVDVAGEGGLLSIAFPPAYGASGRFYVVFVANDANPGQAPFGPLTVMEFRRSATDLDRADPASAREVIAIPHESAAVHYGGQLQFGPDGLFYISVGDGGQPGDPTRNAQNTDSLLGKILRIDPREEGSAPYRIPSDNPFFGPAHGDDRVWAFGLRNPYRFSFDRSGGDLAIADVGDRDREEVDFLLRSQGLGRGANFAWNVCEGGLAYPIQDPPVPCHLAHRTDPVLEYEHVGGGCSGTIIGGYVVRDPTLEELFGRYVYGDFCLGWIRSAVLATPVAIDDRDTGLRVALFSLSSFGEDGCGRVYVTGLEGTVWRLADSTPGNPCLH